MSIFDIYREELHKAVTDHPEDYPWSRKGAPHSREVLSIDTVADRMIEAMKRGSYNKDGRAFKATCKRLGIKHTYTDINAAIKAAAD